MAQRTLPRLFRDSSETFLLQAELPVPEEGDSGDAAAKGGSAGDGGEEARGLASIAYAMISELVHV